MAAEETTAKEGTAVRARYGPYERERLARLLTDLEKSRQDMTWSAMAEAISDWRKIRFQRMSFYRLREPEKYGQVSDENIDYMVAWMEAKHDPDIRARLKPEAIFDEVGKSSRDYLFHLSSGNVLDEWDEKMLRAYAGVYLVQPAADKNSFMPLPTLAAWYKDYKAHTRFDVKGRSLDIKQYIGERSILILQYTNAFYFNAAEFPLSFIFPRYFETMDLRMLYEGIGVVSSNSIHVQLRDCLSRVPKTHNIMIARKTATHFSAPHGLNFYLPPGIEGVKEDWKKLAEPELAHFKREQAMTLSDPLYYAGPSQIALSPVASLKSAITMSFARECVYHRKPRDFLRKPALHFIRSDLDNSAEVQKVIDNPLSIGELV